MGTNVEGVVAVMKPGKSMLKLRQVVVRACLVYLLDSLRNSPWLLKPVVMWDLISTVVLISQLDRESSVVVCLLLLVVCVPRSPLARNKAS